MGRPLNSKLFGERNTDNVGGEGVATVSVGTEGDGYSAANAVVTFSAPQIQGGTTATGTVVIGNTAVGNISSVVITNSGSGYTSAPSVTFTGANTNVAVATATLTATVTNALSVQARFSSTNRASGNDIIKQLGARRFKVRTQDGTRAFNLVARTPAAAGEMAIAATDSANGTYWVKKISGRTATVIQNTGTEFANGAKVRWTLDSATLNTTVRITNV
jgi:hypothetical protein